VRREYEEAFAEIDEIFKIMPIDLVSKIPLKVLRTISENKASDYNIKIQEPLNEQDLKPETIAILGLIYRDYISTPEEREQLQLKDQEELKKIEQEMQEQYDVSNVFEKRKNKIKTERDEEFSTELTLYKEPGFIKRIFNFIKGIFK
jgi:hypothetical protein